MAGCMRIRVFAVMILFFMVSLLILTSNDVNGQSIAGPPSDPVNVDIDAEHDRITITWDPPVYGGGSPVTEYRIYRDSFLRADPYDVVDGDTREYVDRDVESREWYRYRISAVNNYGESDMEFTYDVKVPDPPDPFINDRTKIGFAHLGASAAAAIMCALIVFILDRKRIRKNETGKIDTRTIVNLTIPFVIFVIFLIAGMRYFTYEDNLVEDDPGIEGSRNLMILIVTSLLFLFVWSSWKSYHIQYQLTNIVVWASFVGGWFMKSDHYFEDVIGMTFMGIFIAGVIGGLVYLIIWLIKRAIRKKREKRVVMVEELPIDDLEDLTL